MLMKAAALAAAVLMAAPALARDRSGVDFGRNDSRHQPHGARNRSGAWFGDHHRAHPGPQHGGNWGAHGHFSPRGQGGYHWGW